MSRRALKLLIAVCALLVIGVFCHWNCGPSAQITDARAKSLALRLDMTEEEFDAALGRTSRWKDKWIGEWMEDSQWYATRRVTKDEHLESGERIYDFRQWDFVSQNSSCFESYCVSALFANGKAISLWTTEDRENSSERWLKQLFGRLRLDYSFLSHRSTGPSASKPPI